MRRQLHQGYNICWTAGNTPSCVLSSRVFCWPLFGNAFGLRAPVIVVVGLPVADGQKATLSIAVMVTTVDMPCFCV
jgi:hypothetical protein